MNRLSRREFARLSATGAIVAPLVVDPASIGAADGVHLGHHTARLDPDASSTVLSHCLCRRFRL
jgi:hypothetical protein